jgi:hypothetical protein
MPARSFIGIKSPRIRPDRPRWATCCLLSPSTGVGCALLPTLLFCGRAANLNLSLGGKCSRA